MSTASADPASVARRQQRVEELCAAVIRALAGERDLHFRGRRLHRGRQRLPMFAPHLHPAVEDDDFASFRGAADALALRLRGSDAGLHARLAPADAAERTVFEMLEQFRVESLAGDELPGVRRNLQHRFDAWSLGFLRSRLTETRHGLLLYATAQACRARVTGQPLADETAERIETPRAALSAAVGPHLAALRSARGDQAAYARHAGAIARWVAQRLHETGADDGGRPVGDDADEGLSFGLRMTFDDDGDTPQAVAEAVSGARRPLSADAPPYRVYTTAYDRELRAASLVRAAQLTELRAQLDARLAAQGLNVARLARELKALLDAPQRDDWVGAQEEGLIDGRRLAQLVASPAERRLFRRVLREPVAEAMVAFLIDCSGSMRAHADAVAMLVDVFARALDLAGATSEILGFTTGALNGGRAMREWVRAGRPPRPGRLNEALHLIFKDADTPWRRARRDLAALLEPRLFREGIDGEALAWAAQRLAARPEPRKLLIVVSDGCPMDSATQLANDERFLDRHLQQVAGEIDAGGVVELAAVGVGLDLSPYYRTSRAIDLTDGLRYRQLAEVSGLIRTRR